jgi:hypothetical protein
VAEHAQALRHRLPPADDVEHEVESLRLFGTEMRRAEAPRGRELALVQVDRVDLGRAGNSRALDHREPDGAAADHAHSSALPHLRGLQHRADAGRDRAADQARLLDRERRRQPHERCAVDDRPRRQRARLQGTGRDGSVREPNPLARPGRRATEMSRSAPAPRAVAARRAPAHDHAVADADVAHAFADRLDHPRTFVAEHDRRHLPPAAGTDDVEVGVADAARFDADERLAGPRRLQLQRFDGDAAVRIQDDAAIHDSSISPTLRPPTSASVMSVSAISCRITASAPARPPTASP